MAKMCSNFVAAGARVIFNFPLDRLERSKKPQKNAVCLKNAYKVESVAETSVYCRICFQMVFTRCSDRLSHVFSDVSFQLSSESCNKQSSLCSIKNQKPSISLTSV